MECSLKILKKKQKVALHFSAANYTLKRIISHFCVSINIFDSQNKSSLKTNQMMSWRDQQSLTAETSTDVRLMYMQNQDIKHQDFIWLLETMTNRDVKEEN